MKKALVAVCSLLFFLAANASAEVTVYRDTWGVPHVYADTVRAGMYGLGYAQAEDRLQDLYDNVRIATGTMAEAYGPEHVQQDYFMRVARVAEISEASWKSAPAYQKEICEGFLAGIEAFLADHPDKRAQHEFALQPWHFLTIGHAMVLKWPMGNIMDDLKNQHKKPDFGSNGWAVAPKRSAEGYAILGADPHLTWEGMEVFYEAVVHAGDMHMDGFFLVGSPLVGIGHNGNVAWACTTGGPDTGDVYAMKLNPQNPMQYEYEGEWKNAELKMFTISVKGAEPQQMPALYTIHGPAVSQPKDGVLYVGATPYFEQSNMFEQGYRMVMAKNCAEFYEALALDQLMDQNIPFADREGNIQYVRVGRTPIRPAGYDWSAPVPGHTAATKWLGIHPMDDHVQIKNPEQGYFQNCNISPAMMMVGSPMTPDKYVDYLYNVSWDTQNPRSERLTQLLHNDESITVEEAKAYAMDTYDLLAKPWQKALKDALEAHGQQYLQDGDFKQVADDILAWNGEFTKDETAPTAVERWRSKFEDEIDVAAVKEGKPLQDEDQKQMLEFLKVAVSEIKQTYGKLDVAWGEAHVVGRGGFYYPSNGADFGATVSGPNFTETVFDVRYTAMEDDKKRRVANNGSMAMLLTFLKADKIESYSCIPWGQSADPASPHYMDQGRELYSKRRWKPTWFNKEDLLKNVASEKTLTIP